MSAESIGTSTEVRGELMDLLSRDLVGPWGGPTEEIVGTPRARYLAGALAPISLLEGFTAGAGAGALAPTASSDDVRSEESLAVSDLRSAHEVKGVPADEDESIGEAAPTDSDEDRGPESKIIAPSSMGLRFQVPPGTDVLLATARWGEYNARRETDETGKVQTDYDRTP